MDRCATCRARLGASPICPRCACDFTLSIRAETQAQELLGRAIRAWANGEHDAARELVNASLKLRRTRLALSITALLCQKSNRQGARASPTGPHPDTAND